MAMGSYSLVSMARAGYRQCVTAFTRQCPGHSRQWQVAEPESEKRPFPAATKRQS